MIGTESTRTIFNVNTLVVATLAMISTYICHEYRIYADFPLTMIGIAVVFPIVFSISGAYKRREVALDHYGTLKAYGRAIYFASRDWGPKTDKARQMKMRKLLHDLLIAIRMMFQTPRDERDEEEVAIYSNFSKLSVFINECRGLDFSTSDVSRMNQYHGKMMDAFESMKHIYQYRTPRTLRTYSKIFILVLPVLYGPYFADIGRGVPLYLIFVMPILFSIVLVALDNIQEAMENPFDQVGEDDMQINVEKFIKRLNLK